MTLSVKVTVLFFSFDVFYSEAEILAHFWLNMGLLQCSVLAYFNHSSVLPKHSVFS